MLYHRPRLPISARAPEAATAKEKKPPGRPFVSFLSSSRSPGWRQEEAEGRCCFGGAAAGGSEQANARGRRGSAHSGGEREERANDTGRGSGDSGDEDEASDGHLLLSSVRQRWVADDNKEQGLLKLVFGIGEETQASPASRMIYPFSPFGVMWLGVTCLLLLYTAIVTPAVISFHWLDEECMSVPTLYFDCIVDAFFLCDIVISFCSAVVHQGQ